MPSQVGANIAKFTIGSLSTMVSKNPRIHIDGMVPFLGSQLAVGWKYFDALLACVVAVHSAVFALSFFAVSYDGSKQD